MSTPYDKSYLEHLCDYEYAWQLLFTFSVGVLGVMLLWLTTIDPDSATFVVTVMNVGGASVLALLSGFILVKCRQ